MDETQIKYVIEAALLAAGRPLPFDKLAMLFATKASELDKETLQNAIEALASDYKDRGLELKEVSSGYRIQIKRSMSDWMTPLWDERAPRYTRALLETLALVAYRQPITRAEIEEVRGVAVSTNIMRTLLERSWVRVVGHRDVPGKPAMFGTTKEFLDYFGLKKLEDLPPLADVKDGLPELTPQSDLIEALEIGDEESIPGDDAAEQGASGEAASAAGTAEDATDAHSNSADHEGAESVAAREAGLNDDAAEEALAQGDDDPTSQESGTELVDESESKSEDNFEDDETETETEAAAADDDEDDDDDNDEDDDEADELDDEEEVQVVVAQASGSSDDESSEDGHDADYDVPRTALADTAELIDPLATDEMDLPTESGDDWISESTDDLDQEALDDASASDSFDDASDEGESDEEARETDRPFSRSESN